MTIGEYVDVYPPDVDGVGMVCKSYVEGLNAAGHTAYYISPRGKNPYPANFPHLEFPSIPIPKEPYTVGMPYMGYMGAAYLSDIKKIGFDLVHAHSPFAAGLAALQAAKLFKIPIVTTFHSKYYDDFLSRTKSKILAEGVVKYIVGFYNKCDEVWTVNSGTANVLHDYGYKKDIFILQNGTDLWNPTTEDKKQVQERLGLGEETVFLFVGQHDFKKNIKLIIQALALYRKTHEDFKMIFVGEGPDEDQIQKMAEELGLGNKTLFLGHISDRRYLMRLYARADLFLFPSLYDNAPLVVREAAAAGTPSILIKGSVSAERMIDGYNAFLCENDPQDMKKKMEQALKTASEVGANARRTIPVPWKKIIDTLIHRYESIIKNYECQEPK